MTVDNVLHASTAVSDDAKELDLLLTRMKTLLVEYMDESRLSDGPIIKHQRPDELEKILDLALPEVGVGADGIFSTVEQTLQYSVNKFSPRFMDKLYAGANPIGVMSELLLAGLNGNSHVYHVSPVLTLMEIHVTRALARLFGFQGPRAGGLSCPGGSASNQLAMVTARNALYPEIKTKGYFPRPPKSFYANLQGGAGASPLQVPYPMNESSYGKLIAFTSSAGHYSLAKSAVIMGLGSENIVGVPTDADGRMIPEELERLIQEHIELGHTPFFINATAGTTVFGAFDPIRSCANIAKRYNCWLHVDGSWGGPLIFVPEKAKTLLDGTELADSITINPHKMLQTTLQCSLLLVKDTAVFPTANALNANYLFHGQSHDLGDGTLGCGRRSDAIKLFLGWKYYGRQGYQKRIETSLANVRRFVELLAQDEYHNHRIQMLRLGGGDQALDDNSSEEDGGMEMDRTDDLVQPSLLQVCFWVRPKNSRLIDWRGTEEFLSAVANASLVLSAADGASGQNELLSSTAASSSSVSLASTLSDTGSSAASSVSTPSSEKAALKSYQYHQNITSSSSRKYGHILRSAAEHQEAKAWMETVTKSVHARIRANGRFMIDYAPHGSYLPLFFRVVLNPPTIREIDLQKLVQEILDCSNAVADEIPIPECCREPASL
ncbi:hypothetical protein BGW41_002805 [Actinomortierella wolfii]|nr:hypothetical protein BGW41_002805 [Actinomortierella wolfii]